MRSITKLLFFAPAIVMAAACSKDKSSDKALANDLALAGQARQTQIIDSVTQVERTRAATAAAAVATTPVPMRRAATTTPRRTTHSSSSNSGSSNSGSGVTSAPAEQRTVTEKNTKRDAVIGAAAGAIIGATTSGDKLKGGIIGGAAGAILGGVIGNNVDIKKKKVP